MEFYSCNDCDFEADSEDNLHKHEQNDHLMTSVFSFIDQLMDEKPNELSEEIKEKVKLEKKVVKKHLKEEKEEREIKLEKSNNKNFRCDKCDYSTNIKQSLQRHELAVHKEVVRYACSSCDFKSFYRKNTRVHLKSKHKRSVESKILNLLRLS